MGTAEPFDIEQVNRKALGGMETRSRWVNPLWALRIS